MTRQMVFVGLLLLSVATVSAQRVPVTATMSQLDSSQPTMLVVNNYHAPLTAYNMRASFDKGWEGQRWDARINPGHDSPILPGESRSFSLVTQRTGSPSGPRVLPTHIEIDAALFADGTSAGDEAEVAQIKGNRQGCLSQFQAIAEEFHVLSGQHLDTQAVLKSLESMAQNFATNTTDSAQKTGGSMAYNLTKSVLNGFHAYNPEVSGDQAMAAALKTIEDHITALQMDPVQPEGAFSK